MSKKQEYGKEIEPYLGGYIVGGDRNTYAVEVWDWMIYSGIKSVLDIGCGEGYSTKYFHDHGCEVLGVEGSKKAIQKSTIQEKIILHDFTLGKFIPDRNFDAIWCCEFVEHIERKYLENFLITFEYANKIFLTHALPGQGGYHHVNEQKKEYWIEKIEQRNFKLDYELSLDLRKKTNAKWVKTLLVFDKNK